MTEKEKLGEGIRKIREMVKSPDYNKDFISQQELADISINLTKNYVGLLERGLSNPTLDKLIILAKGLDMEKVTIFNVEIDVNKYISEWLIAKEELEKEKTHKEK
ncbi:helix-turn-helix domain-containing protein [Myroides odoratimimus]|uniref:helix-turn-helix domain-containing protein n=1 Tax=Myroides odoratimimus TaxID=76832 RepID=UPI0025752FCA|nr:helix-turn-helix transcriptional regulator [Myroides odoratimimus]MDM1086410.1 helix-turn-helix transcriptional regulator [Myroides odoratimimus]